MGLGLSGRAVHHPLSTPMLICLPCPLPLPLSTQNPHRVRITAHYSLIDHWGGTAGVLRSKRCAPSVRPLDPRFPARSAHAVHGRSLLIFHLLINKFTLATVLRVILIADLAAARAAAPLGARET